MDGVVDEYLRQACRCPARAGRCAAGRVRRRRPGVRRRQPEVDPGQLWISGASRGSEAAALVATEHPGVVHGLLDLSPSSTVNCAYIPSSRHLCPGTPAWRSHGRPVPSTEEANPAPDDHPAQ